MGAICADDVALGAVILGAIAGFYASMWIAFLPKIKTLLKSLFESSVNELIFI